MTVDQAHDGLLLQLAEQRRFLALSCAAFDAGDHAEAKRIAATLRVLLHDIGVTPALLAQLGSRDESGWLDTAGSLLPLVGSAQTPLVFSEADEGPDPAGATWLPTLDAWDRRLHERRPLPPDMEETLVQMRAEHSLRSRGSWMPFAEWWNAEVLRDSDGLSFTRAELLMSLTQADVDAHADPSHEDVHQRLSRTASSRWATKLEHRPHVPALSPALASVRQVAYEVERSLLRREPA